MDDVFIVAWAALVSVLGILGVIALCNRHLRRSATVTVTAAAPLTIQVHIASGEVFQYEVATVADALAHCAAIAASGYQRTSAGTHIHYPAHRISRVKAIGDAIPDAFPAKEYIS